MKKSVLFVTAALSFGAAAAQTQPVVATVAPALTDVPAGHWARQAVTRLVGSGIVLGYPDGTFRGNQSITRYEAAMIISRLLDRMGKGEVSVASLDEATVTALRNAINELSPELNALEVRLSDLENSAVSREDFARLEGKVDALGKVEGGVSAAQVASINESIALLNSDVADLEGRLADVDDQLVAFDARLTAGEVHNVAQDGRLAALENGRVKLTAGFEAGYGQVRRTAGDTNFDVDRVTEGTFAQEVFTGTSDQDTADKRVRKADTNALGRFKGGPTIGLVATNVKKDNVTVEEAKVNFGVHPTVLGNSPLFDRGEKKDILAVTLGGLEATGKVGDDVRFRGIMKTGTVPTRPDVVNSVDKLKDVKGYNKYLLPDGAVNGATVGVAATSAPLKPTVYVSAGLGDAGKAPLSRPFVAGRVEGKLGEKLNFGLSGANIFAKYGSDGKIVRAEEGRTAFGVDASYKQPKADGKENLFDVSALYYVSLPADSTYYSLSSLMANKKEALEVKANLNAFNVGADLDLRRVSDGYDKVAAMDTDDKDSNDRYEDEFGYGASLSTKLGRAELGAYGDSYTNYKAEDKTRRTAFGAHVGTNINAFRVLGFVSSATNNKYKSDAFVDSGHVQLQDSAARYDIDKVSSVSATDSDRAKTVFAPGKTTDLYKHQTGVGALLTHDGLQANALVPNLDLAGMGLYNYAAQDSYLAGYAGYNAKLPAGVTLKPYVGAKMYEQSAENRAGAADNNSVSAGVTLNGPVMSTVAFKPSFKAAAAYTLHNTGAIKTTVAGVTTTTPAAQGSEVGAKAEVVLNEFFAPATKLSLGYGMRKVDGVKDNAAIKDGSGIRANMTGFSFGGKYAKPVATATNASYNFTHGAFTQLSWNDALKLNYGVFFHDANTKDPKDKLNIGHGFRVNYGLKF